MLARWAQYRSFPLLAGGGCSRQRYFVATTKRLVAQAGFPGQGGASGLERGRREGRDRDGPTTGLLDWSSGRSSRGGGGALLSSSRPSQSALAQPAAERAVGAWPTVPEERGMANSPLQSCRSRRAPSPTCRRPTGPLALEIMRTCKSDAGRGPSLPCCAECVAARYMEHVTWACAEAETRGRGSSRRTASYRETRLPPQIAIAGFLVVCVQARLLGG